MKTLIKSALFVAFALSANSASASPIVATQIIGHDNFVVLDLAGGSQTSVFVKGSYSLADIINRFGTIVTGIYGNGVYYKVHNLGDNQVAILVDGSGHKTNVRTRGDFNDVQTEQIGSGETELRLDLDGHFNDVKGRQTGSSKLNLRLKGDGNVIRYNIDG